MEFHERPFLSQGKRRTVFVLVAVLASLMLAWAGPAQARHISGTNGPDRILGTATADVIKARGGNDRVKGRSGRDRLWGGHGRDRLWGGGGADLLNAVDGRQDRAVIGGAGKDVCRVDANDRAKTYGCETVRIGRGGGGAGTCVVSPPEPATVAAGGLRRAALGDPQPTFSDAFYTITITIEASADGLNGNELPISIEGVCDVPMNLASEAAQLIGGEGVALISSETKVFDATGQQLTGDAATTALAGADSVLLKAQLLRPASWRQDEDGQPVPTFATIRADITD